jgi:hypothetical protein
MYFSNKIKLNLTKKYNLIKCFLFTNVINDIFRERWHVFWKVRQKEMELRDGLAPCEPLGSKLLPTIYSTPVTDIYGKVITSLDHSLWLWNPFSPKQFQFSLIECTIKLHYITFYRKWIIIINTLNIICIALCTFLYINCNFIKNYTKLLQ